MGVDRNGMVMLDEQECLRRLGTSGIGRLAVTVGALPTILPVGYAVHEGAVYFRTAPGTKLTAAVRGAVIAFEVDQVDPRSHAGWSVVIVGPSAVVDDDLSLADVRRRVPRWVASGGDHLVRLVPALVSGREIGYGLAPSITPASVPFDACPDCGAEVFRFVNDGETTNVVCTACFACWQPRDGLGLPRSS